MLNDVLCKRPTVFIGVFGFSRQCHNLFLAWYGLTANLKNSFEILTIVTAGARRLIERRAMIHCSEEASARGKRRRTNKTRGARELSDMLLNVDANNLKARVLLSQAPASTRMLVFQQQTLNASKFRQLQQHWQAIRSFSFYSCLFAALQVDESFTPYASLFSFMPVFSASHLCFNILCSWATQHALTCSRSWMTFTVLFAVFVVRHVSRMIVCCVVCCPASTRNCRGSVG